jgi:hypothetical protein
MNVSCKLRSGFAALAMAVLGAAAFAGEGHDHGDNAPAASGPSVPRFSAASELFEMVGVIDGKRLKVYLDHAATNEPVMDAKVELDIGGVKVVVQPHAEGEFDAELAQAFQPGVLPVTATVSAGKDSDLLAGELDLHEDAPKVAAAASRDWMRFSIWGVGGAIALLALALVVRMVLRRRTAPASWGAGA